MRRLLLALLCAAPLISASPAEAPQSDRAAVPAETVYLASMGCQLADCTDPTHYHACPAGCTDPAHYHDCPIGCADPSHPHCLQEWDPPADEVPEFYGCMGCWQTDCADPAHYHHCPAGCTDPTHYHDCPAGCADPSHPHCFSDQAPAADAAPEFRNSMGCWRADCADPTHYHTCPAGCTDPSHYHDCAQGCVDHAHGWSSVHHGGRGGHHGRH